MKDPQRPPRPGLSLLLRASATLVIIILLTAGATATAALLQIKEAIPPAPKSQPPIPDQQVEVAKPGKPQTIMILGSDRRWSDLKVNNPGLTRSNPARSDTILLIRLDPDKAATSVLSIPRDLKVLIPGHGIDKINAAYSAGGPNLTAATVKQLLGIKINHIINVNFKGFRQVVDALGCVYVDIDRRYYHSNVGLPVSQHYAEIDIQPGYQRLCGQSALDYVRFRHADSDLVRGARQQDFLRAAKDQISTSSLLDDRDELIKILNNNTQTDRGLRTVSGVIKLFKLALYSSGNPVRQIAFPATFTGDAQTGQFVEASQPAIQATVRKWLSGEAAPKKKKKAGDGPARKAAPSSEAPTDGLVLSRRLGENLVAPTVAARRTGIPIFFPKMLTAAARYPTRDPGGNPRVYTLRNRAGREHRAYRITITQSEIDGQYFGVQGTDWMTPPILAHPTSTRVVNNRRLLLFRDGTRLRTVAWKRKDAVYWVSNTLSLALTNDQMLGIASTLTRLPGR